MSDINTKEVVNTISITDKAITEIKKIIEDNKLDNSYFLRVGVKGGGCSGFSYSLTFDNKENPNDNKFDIQGLNVIVDPKSMVFLDGISIDFSDGLQGRGFVFNNPNATKTCGCGSSFGC